jgi:hypothetical protein
VKNRFRTSRGTEASAVPHSGSPPRLPERFAAQSLRIGFNPVDLSARRRHGTPEVAFDSAGAVEAGMGLGEAAGRLLAAVDWEREAYPAYDDFLALPAFVLFFPTVRFLLDRFVFKVRLPLPSFVFPSIVSVKVFDSGAER